MNLLQNFSEKYNGRYIEIENRKVHTPEGLFIRSKEQCSLLRDSGTITIIGNFSSGVAIDLFNGNTPISFRYKPNSKIDNRYVFLRKHSRFRSVFIRSNESLDKRIRNKYKIKPSKFKDQIIASEQILNELKDFNIYFYSKSNDIVTMNVKNSILDLPSLEKSYRLFLNLIELF